MALLLTVTKLHGAVVESSSGVTPLTLQDDRGFGSFSQDFDFNESSRPSERLIATREGSNVSSKLNSVFDQWKMLRVSRLKDGALGVINQWRKQCFTELNEAFLNFVGIDKDWWRQKLERLRLLIEVWGHQHHVNVSELILVVDRSVLESGLFSWFNMDILFPDSLITVAREIDYALITFTLWIAELIRFLCFFNLDAVSGNQLYVLLLKALALNLIKSGDVESNPGPSNGEDVYIATVNHHVYAILHAFLVGLTLKNLVNELIQVQTKWYAIGLQIGIESHRLKAIKQESSGLERLSEVIERWLRENTEVPVSWKSVVKALKAPSVGEKGLADQLHKKYCQPDDASGGQARHSDIQEGISLSVHSVCIIM